MECIDTNPPTRRRVAWALVVVASALALAAPAAAQAATPVLPGFHIPAGRDVHGMLRCYFGSNSVTCVPSLPYEFEKPCSHGERRFGLNPKLSIQPKGTGCTPTRLSHAGSTYVLRPGNGVLAPDHRTVCNYSAPGHAGSLLCYHPHDRPGRGFEFFPSTGNLGKY